MGAPWTGHLACAEDVEMADGGRIVATRRSRPTITDVAHAAGVSTASVSYVLNRRPGVGEATRRRVLEAAEQLAWEPRARARALAAGQAMAIGFVVARRTRVLAADPYFALVLSGIEEALQPSGCALLLKMVNGHGGESLAYRQLARQGRVDGFLLTDPRRDDPRPDMIRGLDVPAVGIGPFSAEALPEVATDERQGIRRAVQHLVELGHRRIAHVCGPSTLRHAAMRREGWRDAMRSHDLRPGRCLSGQFTEFGGARATWELLNQSDPPTAIFYGNDAMAIAGMEIARQLGFGVPRDLSIVGFDDIPAARLVFPPLTTISQDPVAAGRVATQVLLALVKGTEPPTTELQPTRLIVRASTAPAPAS
jgi:DNA-binding LacI/PurR family transcriptional regulator